MSKFSIYLKQLIDESGEPISSIARKIGAERTSIHKAIKDERILPYKTVHALAVHLQLSMEERQEFFRLYDMLLQGEDVWHNRAAVSELLNQLSLLKFQEESARHSQLDSLFAESVSDGLIEGEYAVQSALYTLLAQDASAHTDVHFEVFLPFGTDQTTIFRRLWQEGIHFHVDQLFCFPTVIDNDCSQSVRTLQQIIPLCLIARDFYHPFYFYEHPASLAVHPLNYYIITPSCLILLSQDLSAALVQRSERLVQHFSEHFHNLMEHCEPLISCATNLSDILTISSSIVNPSGCLYLMPQPCFGRYYTPELIAKYFQVDLSSMGDLYDAVVKHFALVQNVERNFTTVFSEQGLQYFIRTGILTELPQEYVPAIELEDRILFLTSLRDDIASGTITGRIARPSSLHIPDYLTLYVDAAGHTWFDTTASFIHGAYYCDIHISEKSICHAFQDFFESLSGSSMVYSQEETLRILDNGIQTLTEKAAAQS